MRVSYNTLAVDKCVLLLRGRYAVKILITTPNLQKHGGVASYTHTLKEHFSVSVDYFIVGKRSYE